MKKIFTLLAGILLACGAQAQTATDSYLDIANYASLDNIDLRSCTKLYSYDEEKKVLVLSGYAAYQSSVQGQGDAAATKNCLGFVTYTAAGSSTVSGGWAAEGDFNGSAYYGLLDKDGNASDRAAALKSSQAYTFKVTNITKVSVLGKSGKKTERQVIMTVKEGDTEIAKKIDDTNTIATLTVDELDASKTYDVTVVGNTSDNGHFYEIAFYQAGGSGEQPEVPNDPTPATVWDFTKELSSTDAANLTADAANWTFDSEKGYWSNETVITERNVYTTIKANNADLELTQGIEFTRDNKDGLDKDRIRIAPEKYFAINGSAAYMKLANLSMNDEIKLRVKGAGTSNREITIINGDASESYPNQVEGEGSEAKTVVYEITFVAAHNGDVLITPSNGYQFMAITINAALPEEDTTGIQTVKAATTTGAAMYNLAGQKVAEGYKGVVIQNGKKMVK